MPKKAKGNKFINFLDRLAKLLVEDFLIMVLTAFAVMVAALVMTPSMFGVVFKEGVPAMAYLYYILNFTLFMYMYYVLVTLLIFWLSRKLFRRIWDTQIKWAFLLLGFVIAFGVFSSVPSDAYDIAAYDLLSDVYTPEQEDVDDFNQQAEALEPGESMPDTVPLEEGVVSSLLVKNSVGTGLYKYRVYEDEFCGEKLEYMFTLQCGVNEQFESNVEILEQTVKTPIDRFCLGLNAKEVCESAGHRYPDNYNETKEVFGKKTRRMPVLIVGCKYSISLDATLEDLQNFVCEKIGDCQD